MVSNEATAVAGEMKSESANEVTKAMILNFIAQRSPLRFPRLRK